MNTESEKKVRKMPTKKGGSSFPRVAFNEAIGYARKLVSKTHAAAQPQDVIFSGVVGAKNSAGQIRISALKQFGLISGDIKKNYSAEDLAKKISAAPPEEVMFFYRQAMLNPLIFRKLFETFHGDTISKAKLKQRAADLKVHPDETAVCVDLYILGMKTAGLVSVEGDQVTHLASSDVKTVSSEKMADEAELEATPDDAENEGFVGEDNCISNAGDNGLKGNAKVSKLSGPNDIDQSGPRAVFNVNVTLDSSLDIEKLQKQLELLKRFGAI